MMVPLSCLNDPARRIRHIVRVRGDDRALEALVDHIVEGEGYWLDDDELDSALAYIDDRAAVLEFYPEYYVPAGFAMVDFAVTRGPARATVVFDECRSRRGLIRLTMAFHPNVLASVAIIDAEKPDGVWVGEFACGVLAEDWHQVRASEVKPEVTAGLSDTGWEPASPCRDGRNRGLALDGACADLGFIQLRGSADGVQAFRRALLSGEVPHTACYLEDSDEDNLIVHFRYTPAVEPLARLWSETRPSLDIESVVTNRSGVRTHQRFVLGDPVLTETLAVTEEELRELFARRIR